MPVNLSIKNVPDDVAQRLRERAKQHHRSMQGEMLSILEEAIGPRKPTLREAIAKVKALDFRTGDDSTRWIREDRDAR